MPRQTIKALSEENAHLKEINGLLLDQQSSDGQKLRDLKQIIASIGNLQDSTAEIKLFGIRIGSLTLTWRTNRG